jgi:hypothetical protein
LLSPLQTHHKQSHEDEFHEPQLEHTRDEKKLDVFQKVQPNKELALDQDVKQYCIQKESLSSLHVWLKGLIFIQEP